MNTTLTSEKKAAHEKRRKRGLLCLGLGATVLGSGFLLQYVLYVNGHSFGSIMYSLTLVGIGLIFYAAMQFFS